MPVLQFDTGLVTYKLNDVCEVQFNPTDNNFAERLFKSFDDLENRQEVWKKQVERMADKKEIFDFCISILMCPMLCATSSAKMM